MSLEDVEKYLVLEWQRTKNPNAFLFNEFVKEYPHFFDLKVQRGGPNKKNYNLEKTFYQRLINKIMTTSKNSCGKKLKARRLFHEALKKKSEEVSLQAQQLLITLLIRTVPNYTVRRLKYGSGFLTKLVRLTVPRKVTWFLKTFVLAVKKRNVSFYNAFSEEVDLVLNRSTKSQLLSQKRENQISALKANLY